MSPISVATDIYRYKSCVAMRCWIQISDCLAVALKDIANRYPWTGKTRRQWPASSQLGDV